MDRRQSTRCLTAKTEGRRQRAENRGQRAEGRGQRAEDRGRRNWVCLGLFFGSLKAVSFS